MAYNLRKRTKVNLSDSTSTTNSTNPNHNNNSNDNNNNNEIAPVIIEEKNEHKESNDNNKKEKGKMENINEGEGDKDDIQNIEQQQNQQQHANVEQIQTPQQQGVDSFSGNIIIHQLLQATNLFFQLDSQSILSLTLTSKTVFKPLSSLISQHLAFHPKHTPLIHYHPKKLKIETFDIDGLFDDPYLSSVTEIDFTTYNKYSSDLITHYPFDKAITILLSLNLITYLTISCDFNQPINSLIHLTKLTHLEFSTYSGFNHPIDNLLPPSLTKLSMGLSFNHPINHLPPNLIKLSLGIFFNQPINLLYLTKLTNLKFGHRFSQPIDNLLPQSLTNLILGRYFDHPIDHLPPNITHLVMPKCTDSQYKHIKKMPSLLYFNSQPMKPKQLGRKRKEVT